MKLIDIIDSTPIRFGYRIAFLTIFFREPLLKRMEMEFGIVRPEWTVLICLIFRDGLCARDICEITEQPSNTISRAVTSLEQKGHIRSETDAGDARRKNLFLEPSGRDLHDRIMPMFEDAERKLIGCLTDKEKKSLDQLLDKMARHVPNW